MSSANTCHAIFIFSIFYQYHGDYMITADFRPKDHGLVCENCIHYEECPIQYVCPTLDRIYTEELLEKILEEQEE